MIDVDQWERWAANPGSLFVTGEQALAVVELVRKAREARDHYLSPILTEALRPFEKEPDFSQLDPDEPLPILLTDKAKGA